MTTTTDAAAGVQMIALEAIRTDRNVRQQLDDAEVDSLAQSIKLLGQLTPVSVLPAEDGGYVLITGHKRYAALASLGETHIRAEIRADGSQEESERAAENIVRSALNPYEEAVAVKAMLDRGLSVDGAAQALGWNRARVTARMKLLELPELAQQMIGDGRLALASVEPLRAIGAVSPDLLEAVIDYLADGNEWAGERLAGEPGWVLDSALRSGKSKVFAAHLGRVDSFDVAQLRLGKKAEAMIEEAAELHRKIDRYAYGAPAFAFSDEHVDQARAAGVLIEFDRHGPVIVDRSLYRELAKDAIAQGVPALRDKAAAIEAERKRDRQRSGPADPLQEARREEGRQLRELGDQAHGVNLELGAGLLNGLAAVDPADLNVARFFVYGLLGADYDGSPYTQSGERVAGLAVTGIRLVIDEFRADVTKRRKDGSRGRLRIDYGDRKEPTKPIEWLWKFIDGAKTASELYGRALVVIAAEQHACRLVVPNSQRMPATRWSSHKDHAAKALAKLVGPHVPASLKKLERAIERAHQDRYAAEQQAHEQADGDSDPDAQVDVDEDAELTEAA